MRGTSALSPSTLQHPPQLSRCRSQYRHMRTFVQLRRFMDTNRDLARKIEALEKKYDEQFTVVFEAIKQLIATPRRAAQTNWLSSIALPSVAELLSAEDCLPKLGLITDHDPPITGLPTLSQNQVQSRNATSGLNRVRTFDLRIILAFS